MQQACTYHQSGVGAQQVWLDVLEDSWALQTGSQKG
jgi:hypothetical protein